MQPLSNENQLIASVLVKQDKQAFSSLVLHYQQALRQYCRRLCSPDISLADDIAQETFWQAFKKLHLYQGKGKFLSWLFSIAYYQFLQHLRAKKSYDELGEHDDSHIFTEQVDQAKDLEKAMEKLKMVERACITLQFSFGYSQEEISHVINLPLGTVKSHVKRGKDKLSQILRLDHSSDDKLNGVA